MNKDALLATIIGFGIGLIIAAGVFLGPSIVRSMPQIRLPEFSKKPAAPTPTPKQNEALTIQSPLAESIELKNETLVTGSVAPESIVVIEGESGETVSAVNSDGAFAGKVVLTEGKNDITVTSYTKDKVQTSSVRVYYTPEDF